MTTTAVSSSSSPVIQELGLGSNLDVNSIISGLMSVNDIPLTELQNQVTSYQSELSAYGQLSSALSTFQGTVAEAALPATFQTLTASVANSAAATAAVSAASGSAAATVGNHSLSISQLAQNQVIASGDFTSPTATVGTGTITIQYGTFGANNSSFTASPTAGAQTITITSANDSLTGVVAAINNAKVGVSASIVNDGTGSRLVLSGNATGAANGFKLTVSDSDGNDTDDSGLSALAYDPTSSGGAANTTLLQSSQDANLSIDNIAITSASNTVTGALQGVSLNLQGTTTTPTTLSVTQDSSQANGVIQGFVNGYNTLVQTITSLTSYDSSTNTASPLTGDSTAQLITTNLQNIAAATFSTGDASITDLNDLGITFNDDGTLTLDQSKLNSALASDPSAVQQIFASTGKASDALVNYTAASSNTQPGSYALNVTQLATQGQLSGSSAAGLNITAGSNDSFGLDLDSTNATITIPDGNYASASALAAAVQTAINTNATLVAAGVSVSVTNNNGVLTLTPTNYGSGSSATVDSSAGALNLFGSAPVATTGQDVEGTLGGVAFIGNGQSAIGATGSAADGLTVTIAGGSTGARGTVDYSEGVGSQMSTLLTQYLDPTNGIIASATNGVNASIANLTAQETAMQANLEIVQSNLEAEFEAMDTLVAKLNDTSSFLSQELGTSSSSSNSSSSNSGTISSSSSNSSSNGSSSTSSS